MVKSAITVFAVIAVGLSFVLVSGCKSDAQKGAGLGALAGAGVGAIVGHQSGKTAEGALIGGAVGGGAGYIVGNEQDKKKAAAERDTLRQEMNTVTVNITNSNGSVSQVLLRKQGVGYVGPRGEYYNSLPTEDQLRPIYGF
ncbi:MAG TPA: glycine zipper domain-containing protein [Sedimentisphaerales bacterium]|nr:glycine zipper domain-containing protein [Sedimentisphaerales bacterium]